MVIPKSSCLVLLTALVGVASSNSQAPYGPWVHDNSATPLAIYVDGVGGNDLFPGILPALAVQTIAQALVLADAQTAATGLPVTINVTPGSYVFNDPLSVPAFGVSLEAYRSPDVGAVDLQLTAPVANRAVIEIDRPLGPQAQRALGSARELPPSVIRGITLRNNTVGQGIEIDVSSFDPAIVDPGLPIAVQVVTCAIRNCRRGIRIQTINAVEVVATYECEIVDNEIANCTQGIDIMAVGFASDLIRSNRIHGGMEGICVGKHNVQPGGVRARILSNAIYDMGDQFGIRLQDVSADIVNNTVAFVRGPAGTPPPASIWYAGSGVGETLVVVNNILFSPLVGGVNPEELAFTPGFSGTLTVLNNDFDATSPAAVFAASPTNIAIATPNFVSMTAPYDVHLTGAAPSVVNLGDQTFVVPGAATQFVLNGRTYRSNCALDMDLDSRTHEPRLGTGVVLHRGSDQRVADGIRLTAPNGGLPLSASQADVIGTVVPGPTGTIDVRVQVAGPPNSFQWTFLCSTMPMGNELQHVAVPGIGSLALDPAGSSSFIIWSSAITISPATTMLSLGALSPMFLEAEMYLQSLVLRADGSFSFSNRIRFDVDQN